MILCLICYLESNKLVREVVLLTDDKHLSLKAHLQNVPVTAIKKFHRWLKS